MKKFSSVLAAVALVLAVVPSATAAAPAKATGDFWFMNGSPAHGVFVAQATDPARGTWTYSDAVGYYTINVTVVQIDSTTTAHFAGPVVDSTWPGIGTDKYVAIAVYDGGEPGIGVDKVMGGVFSTLADAAASFSTMVPSIPTTAGNIQVHTYAGTSCTFSAPDSAYYNGMTPAAGLYATGPVSFTWVLATGVVTAGYWTEMLGSTPYHNIVADGTVLNGVVNLHFTRTSPTANDFLAPGTLSGGLFIGTAQGPYLWTASGSVVCR